jgi:hypothetical protein
MMSVPRPPLFYDQKQTASETPAIILKNRRIDGSTPDGSERAARRWSGATAARHVEVASGGSSSRPLSWLWSPTALARFDGCSI